MKKFLLYLIFLLSISATGCTRLPTAMEAAPCRVVTEIVIRVENVPEPGLCRYTDPAKMIKALNCLRRLDPWDLPDTDPEAAPGPRYRIALEFSDGSSKSYDLIGNSYFRENSGPWYEVSPDRALRIPLLLAAVPSDAIH